MKEVYPDIFMIKEKGALGVFRPEVNIYVLAGSDGLIFDAGYGNKGTVKAAVREIERIRELFGEQGREFRITRIIPSHAHPDHFSGLKALRKYTGARILLTSATAAIIKSRRVYYARHGHDMRRDFLVVQGAVGRLVDWLFRRVLRAFYHTLFGVTFMPDPDEIISDTAEIVINGERWRIFPSPGHASDHISLYNPSKGILLSGDNVLRSITTWLGPPDSDLEKYMASLEYIASLGNLEIILSAHGSPITDPRGRLRQIIDSRRERPEQVLRVVRGGGRTGLTAGEITRRLYRREGKIKQELARGWVALTLVQLESQNRIRRFETGRGIFFVSE
jgi:glyoxylase-like metal-dependent hydrolase (beta-lactamase superfamily II)